MATNLVINGGFETGDFTGWTLSGSVAPLSYGPQVFVINTAQGGQSAGGFGPVGSDGTLSQDIQTTAGQHYTLDFWLANASGGPNDFTVKWNGQTLLALVNRSAQGYTEYTFDVVGTSGTSNLEFDFRQDPSYWSLDSISVTAVGSQAPAVPEITVLGNGVSIADSDSTPSGTDNTDFGSATLGGSMPVQRTFTVRNDGGSTLTTSGLTLPTGFSLAEGLSTSIAPGSSDTFTVQLDTTSTGTKSGQISFTNNDGNENPFNFSITGTVNSGGGGNPTNLVINGGFETGDFTGWTLSGSVAPLSYGPQVFVINTAQGGQSAGGFGPVGSDGTLSQDIQTTAGQHYTLDFWLANASGGPNDFTVKWSGQTLLALVNQSAQGYTEYTFDVVGTSGTSNLEFDFRQDPSHWSLDSISVTAVGSQAPAVPEITVLGNGVSIADSDSTPSGTDNTDFGSATLGGSMPVQRTFTVRNDGGSTLTTSGLTLPTGFSLAEGLSTSIAPGSSDTFTVQLDTTSTGTKSGQISFTNNDGNENPFNFSITGTVNSGGGGNPTNLVINGGFETGDFTGWTLSGSVAPLSYGPQVFVINTAQGGQSAGGFGPVGSDGTLSQDIQTTAGQHYTLDFWLANASGGPNDFTVKWSGQTLLALVNQSAQGYTEYTFDVVGTSGTSNLEFDFRQDPSHWSLDSISVTAVGSQAPAVPEITVLGNGVSIADSNSTPSGTDNTDFGSATLGGSMPVQRTFTVRNDGGSTLTTSGLTLPTGFSLAEGLSTSIAPGSSDTFTVQLDTTSTGTKSGQISFTNNDGNENPFNFSITGTVNSGGGSSGGGQTLYATPANFASQVSAATAGQTIVLASGNYGTWTGTNKAITITAASGASPQVKFNFGSGDANFTLDSITGMGGFIGSGASNITIRNSTFTSQLDIEGAVTNIVVEHNDFTWMPVDNGTANSKIFLNTSGSSPGAAVTIENNDIENGGLDGIHIGGGSGVLILNNIFRNLIDVGLNHTDNIQFESGSQIVVRGNYIYANGPTQGITSYNPGTNGVIIEDNVVDIPRDWGIEFYSDVNSIIRHNTVVYHPASYSSFGTGSGRIDINRKPTDPAGSGTQVYDNITTEVSFSNGSTGTAYNNVSGANAIYVGGASPTTHDGFLLASNSPVGRGAASDGADVGVRADSVGPAGVAGEAINLGLTNPTDHVGSITVNMALEAGDLGAGQFPSGWTISAGTDNGDGTWTVQTDDIAALSVTSPESYTGALILNVAESWVNADGSSGYANFADNVEVYAKGAPIFALSRDDNLTGSGGGDVFVFARPIGNDLVYNFDVALDKIDLIGFNNVASFSDIQTNLTDDANGNAVIAIGAGETITLPGVDASSLNATNFVFDQQPVTNNTGNMVVSDGATLPLGGILNNSGAIVLNSISNETDLELIQHGITLQGGGVLRLSDSGANAIFGTDPSVTLTNVDNTISGAGQLGEGRLTLDNRGAVIASGGNALTIDTGPNAVVNSGTLEATGSGGLTIHSDVANSGLLWANGGSFKVDGNVSGTGSARINGVATFEMGGAFGQNVKLDTGADATLKIDHVADFNGTVAGFDSSDLLDLADVAFGSNTTLEYAANSNNTGGILTVSDGTHTANVALLGQYMAADFVMSADGLGGTLIQDLPLATQTQMLTQPQYGSHGCR